MKYFRSALLLALFSIILSCTPTVSDQQEGNKEEKPLKVILMIGDGMGLAQVGAAMIANPKLNLERTQVTGLVTTHSADNLITDSAAGGTALATGNKTYNGAISVDTTGAPLKTLVEYAEENGMNTGVIATSSITHATPASFFAHNKTRQDDEGIASDLLKSGVDVFMGGGRKFFAQRNDKVNLISELESNGYFLAKTMDEVKSANAEKLGYFIDDEQPVSYVSGRGNFL
ncbi:MAG: alkaline phosphatase, partial [Cyclobacteriaceae bacterium]